jgi:DNA-binding Lrp family transcriptional regulator
VLTALSILALRDSPSLQTTVLRLIALVTARYDWKRDQVSVPQGDMARMWQVSERTVKREIKRMVSSGLVTCVRPGVRGRVAAYRLDYAALCERSRSGWADVGPDFDARMSGMTTVAETKVVKVDFTRRPDPPELPPADDFWGQVLQDLARADPANLHNWYMKLRFVSAQEGRVVLEAPSGFVAQFVETHLARVVLPVLARRLGQRVVLKITS